MSTALVLLILGQNYTLGQDNYIPNLINSILPSTNHAPVPSTSIELPSSIDSNSTLNIELSRRADYTYTPGIGAHKVHTKMVLWGEAWRRCRNEHGHLAIINSYAESKLLSRLIGEIGPYSGPKHFLIGFHDLYQKNEWVTIHGQSLPEAGFAEWQDGEPNDKAHSERCGSIYVDGTLNDVNCNTENYGFICELQT